MRFKRTFSLLVCAALAAALLPCAPACAASAAWDGTTIDVSWYNESDTEVVPLHAGAAYGAGRHCQRHL